MSGLPLSAVNTGPPESPCGHGGRSQSRVLVRVAPGRLPTKQKKWRILSLHLAAVYPASVVADAVLQGGVECIRPLSGAERRRHHGKSGALRPHWSDGGGTSANGRSITQALTSQAPCHMDRIARRGDSGSRGSCLLRRRLVLSIRSLCAGHGSGRPQTHSCRLRRRETRRGQSQCTYTPTAMTARPTPSKFPPRSRVANGFADGDESRTRARSLTTRVPVNKNSG